MDKIGEISFPENGRKPWKGRLQNMHQKNQ